MAVSLDGVMAPMKDGQRQAKRHQARAKGQTPSGPAGYQEVGCATVSDYDRPRRAAVYPAYGPHAESPRRLP